MGPTHPTTSADYLDRGADYVLLGEAEWTLLELVGALLGHGSLTESLDWFSPILNFNRRTPSRALMKVWTCFPS